MPSPVISRSRETNGSIHVHRRDVWGTSGANTSNPSERPTGARVANPRPRARYNIRWHSLRRYPR